MGVTHDPTLGPAVLVGLGGIFAEVVRDVAVRPVPLDEDDAWEMVRSLRGFPLLDGARGRPRVDQRALVRLVVTVARMAEACGDRLAELDLNPVLARPTGRRRRLPGRRRGSGPEQSAGLTGRPARRRCRDQTTRRRRSPSLVRRPAVGPRSGCRSPASGCRRRCRRTGAGSRWPSRAACRRRSRVGVRRAGSGWWTMSPVITASSPPEATRDAGVTRRVPRRGLQPHLVADLVVGLHEVGHPGVEDGLHRVAQEHDVAGVLLPVRELLASEQVAGAGNVGTHRPSTSMVFQPTWSKWRCVQTTVSIESGG